MVLDMAGRSRCYNIGLRGPFSVAGRARVFFYALVRVLPRCIWRLRRNLDDWRLLLWQSNLVRCGFLCQYCKVDLLPRIKPQD